MNNLNNEQMKKKVNKRMKQKYLAISNIKYNQKQ